VDRSQAVTGEGRPNRAAVAARPQVPQAAPVKVQEPPRQRYGLIVVLAILAVALVVWVVLGAPLPVH